MKGRRKRLARVKGKYPDFILTSPDDVRMIFLLMDDPKKYHKFAVGENDIGITRKIALQRLFKPLRRLEQMTGRRFG